MLFILGLFHVFIILQVVSPAVRFRLIFLQQASFWQSSVALLPFDLSRIYTSEDKCKLRSQNLRGFTRPAIFHPGETSAFQAFVVENKSIEVPEQDLHPIAPLTEKDKKVPTKRVLPEVCLDETRQAIEALSHVHGLVAQKYFGRRWQI
jgi:hypothetical protein